MHACLFLCMYVCMYVCLYVCLCIHAFTRVCAHMCMYVCLYVWMYKLCMHACLCAFIMYVCMYLCMYVCMNMYNVFYLFCNRWQDQVLELWRFSHHPTMLRIRQLDSLQGPSLVLPCTGQYLALFNFYFVAKDSYRYSVWITSPNYFALCYWGTYKVHKEAHFDSSRGQINWLQYWSTYFDAEWHPKWLGLRVCCR